MATGRASLVADAQSLGYTLFVLTLPPPSFFLINLTVDDLTRQLSEQFGFARFRPGQEEVIRAVLAGRDAMTVMPTGQGKSLCYQLPATLLPGLTLVISPLIDSCKIRWQA